MRVLSAVPAGGAIRLAERRQAGTSMSGEKRVVIRGVDTHKDVHVAAVIDQVGKVIDTADLVPSARGCEQLPALHLNATERVYACANEARPVGSFVRRPPEHRLPLVL